MKKLSLDQLEDAFNIIQNECPGTGYSELIRYERGCHKVENCFECWYESVIDYSVDKYLESMNDNEKEE